MGSEQTLGCPTEVNTVICGPETPSQNDLLIQLLAALTGVHLQLSALPRIVSAAESHLLQGHASLFLSGPLPKSLIPMKAERLGPLSLIQDSSWRAILVQLFPMHWVNGVMGLCYLDLFLLNIGSSHILIVISLSTFWMLSQDTVSGPTVFWPEVSLL